MTTPMRMEEDRSHVTERILNLTLEIIYLLTGESYPVVKSGDQVTIRVPPPRSLKSEKNREKKILEVTQKITELLTGEVPIRCQDVIVYFSMEEWEYLEGHKELYKDIMMASQPTLTSLDGSSNGKPPERCPHPLYSHRNSTQTGSLSEVRVVVKEEVKEEDEKYGVMGELSKGHKDLHKDTIMEPSNSTIQPERCPHLLYAKQEGHKCPPFDQGKAVMDIKVEGEAEETNVRDDQQYTEEEEAGMTMTFIVGEEDMTGEKTMSSAMDGGHHSVDKVWTPSDSEHPPTVEEEAGTQGKKKFCCSTCGRCFTTKSSHVLHQKSHAADRPYYCSECGKCFLHKSKLISHYRSHTGEKLYSCDQCGKCYSDQYSLSRHKKSHTDIKPYSCPKCKKLFHYKHSLVVHLRCHTGEKPYTCAECGKCFRRNSNLSRHKKLHTGEMPYFCSECGKSFRYKHSLLLHQRAHTGEKPYSCADCGKTFSDKSHVVRHEKTHMANQDPDDDDVIVL